MCGRLNIVADPLSVLLMQLVGLPYSGGDAFNLAPTQQLPVLRMDAHGTPELVPMRWWLTPFWARELSTRYAMFNARAETAATSAAFKEPYRKRRCVVPVSGFYEWCRRQDPKLPYLIEPRDTAGLLLAGLWDSWRQPESGEPLLSFTILTAAAHPAMAFVHHRQPVMLSHTEAADWLDMQQPTEALVALFTPRLPIALQALPVSTHVNNARHTDARCMQAIGTAVPMTQNSES